MNIYADHAATTKVGAAALEAMLPCFTAHYGNPSSIHSAGEGAMAVLAGARNEIAAHLGADPGEIYFTSGGTESDNWAIHTASVLGRRQGRKHIISTAIEHHGVLHPLNALKKQGFEITLLPVNAEGLVDPEELTAAIREDTILVSVMYANNEIGTIQPISRIGEICRQHQILFHTDAVQAAGHIPIDVKAAKIDLLSLSAHKFHGPKGAGVLYCRNQVPLSVLIAGGAQEKGLRGGTENVPAIAGMAAALREACRTMEADKEAVSAMKNKLIQAFSKIEKSHFNGSMEHALPGIVNYCFEGIEGEALLLMLNMSGICASSGSACTSGSLDPSHVLLAIGRPHEIAHGSLRISLSRDNTPEEIDYIIRTLPPIIDKLRDMSPVWERITKQQQA